MVRGIMGGKGTPGKAGKGSRDGGKAGRAEPTVVPGRKIRKEITKGGSLEKAF